MIKHKEIFSVIASDHNVSFQVSEHGGFLSLLHGSAGWMKN